MKKIVLLGSTGSIGVNTLKVIKNFPELFEVNALTANTNIDLLEKQIYEFNPKVVVVINSEKAAALRKRISNKCEILDGDKAILDITKRDNYDILVSSLVGFAGLKPTIEGIKLGKRIALANKETLVAAGELINNLCEKYDAELLPIDSEHSAIFQCLVGENHKEIRKIILTASGGPFLSKTKEELKNVTIAEALNHPNWDMGNKVTIDSATMMNKGLEVIEARWLFEIPKEKIEIVIHPQSIIHSMIEFVDGSIKAQLSLPDMKLPIQYALTYPKRLPSNFVTTNLPELHKLTFYEPDMKKFKTLQLAYQALGEGGTAPCVLNAANEIAVNKFLNGKIKFTQIAEIITESLEKFETIAHPELETIFDYDYRSREYAKGLFN